MFDPTTVFALYFQLAGLDVGLGGANDDTAYDEHLANHVTLNRSNLNRMVVTANDHLPLPLFSHVLVLVSLKICLHCLLHQTYRLDRTVG